jgi:predicted dehydrogenase
MNTRIYLVGAGFIAQHHAAAVRHLPGGDEIPICISDPNPTVVARFLERFPRARAFPSVAELLREPARPDDIVIVATPPAHHHPFALQALRSGRHLLCEKPMALNQGQVDEMLAAARAANRRLGCCSCRFLGIATTEMAREILQSRGLGPLYHVTFIHGERRMRPGIEFQPSSPWFLEKSMNGGGTLMNMGPYDFTTLNYLLAPRQVEVLHAWQTNPITPLNLPPGVRFDTEQHLGATLRYDLGDGNPVTVTYERFSCTYGAAKSICEIEGLTGALRWNWLEDHERGSLRFSYDLDGALHDEDREMALGVEIPLHERPLVYFHRLLQGIPAPIAVDGQAAFNFSVLLAIYRAAETGKPQTVTRG